MIGQLMCNECMNRSFKALTKTDDTSGERKIKLAALVCTKCNKTYALSNSPDVTEGIEGSIESTRLQ